LADTVNRVAYSKERIILQRRGKGLAAVVPMEDLEILENLESARREAKWERAAGLVRMDDEDGLFAKELEAARLNR
jgi:hypothetical protein